MDLSNDLNTMQLRAVNDTEGASLVIAGAGSGKTRVLTYRIANLLYKGVPAYKILALTFTNKAAKEMRHRIDALLECDISSRLWMGTFHSIFSSILRIEAEQLGYTSDFTIYDSQDQRNMLKSIIKELGLDDKIYNANGIAARISLAKNNLITAEAYSNSSNIMSEDAFAKRPRINEIYSIYQSRCKMSNVMDFDDLLLQMNILLRDFPDILEKYRKKFSYILVDEYQDTNYAQYLIIKKLSEIHNNICVVGDDAQSIYSFRGARIENILNFKNDYPEYKLYKLEQNYRSTSTIVNAANSVIEQNDGQIKKNIFSKNEIGEPIKVIRSLTDREEAVNIAQEIKKLSLSSEQLYSHFAILYRTNAQSRVLEEALRRMNIPYRIYGAKSFFQRQEIKDILAYIRLSVNPNDEESIKRVINVPKRGIGSTTVEKIQEYAMSRSESVWDTLEKIEKAGPEAGLSRSATAKVASFRDLIRNFIEASNNRNAYEASRYILEYSGMDQAIRSDDSPEGISRKENKQELLNSIKEFSENAYKNNYKDTTAQYISTIQLLTDQDKEEDEAGSDYVSMMTIHAAKGLEFDNVFITGLEEELFPAVQCMDNHKSLEEERRLFYVAITRAGKRLFLSHAMSRYRNGQVISSRPSRFLSEIPQEFKFKQKTENIPNRSISSIYIGNKKEPGRMFTPTRSSMQNRTSGLIHNATINNKHIDTSGMTPVDNRTLVPGEHVIHPTFGKGTVVGIENSGQEKKATINFNENGTRTLLLRFAKLFKQKN